ncbi:MAG: lipoprotein [Pseudomonadota bacterium]
MVMALGAVAALSACGKKGELQLPPPEAPPQVDDQTGGDPR